MNRPNRLGLSLLAALLAACASRRPGVPAQDGAVEPAREPVVVQASGGGKVATRDGAIEVRGPVTLSSGGEALVVVTPAPAPGAAGIGDSLIPGQGNGGYDVQSYGLDLDIEAAAGPLRGTCTIDARATQALSRFNLDFHGLEVESVTVDGAAATFEREEDELVITPARALAAGARFECVVRYSGSPKAVKDPSMPGFTMGWLARDGEAYVFSQPAGAMTFFPCNDHPLDKALFRFRLRVPRPLQAVANGTLVRTLEEESARTYEWSARDPMATYLVTIAIAEFDSETYTTADGLEITNWFTKKSRESSRKAFQRTDEILAFFSESFGPYPFEIAGNILTSARVPGALETQTKPVYGAGTGSEEIIAHELAHQWFGNAVCVKDWNDIWINEGVAEYAAWMYVENQKGAEAFEKKLREGYGLARATKAPPPGDIEVKEMFGTAVYMRGPLALHFLRKQLGDERFLGLMRTWVAEHLHGNASLEDFLALVDRLGGAPARAAIDPWLFEESMPKVEEWDAWLEQRRAEREAARAEREKLRQRERNRDEAKSGQDASGTDAPKPDKPSDG